MCLKPSKKKGDQTAPRETKRKIWASLCHPFCVYLISFLLPEDAIWPTDGSSIVMIWYCNISFSSILRHSTIRIIISHAKFYDLELFPPVRIIILWFVHCTGFDATCWSGQSQGILCVKGQLTEGLRPSFLEWSGLFLVLVHSFAGQPGVLSTSGQGKTGRLRGRPGWLRQATQNCRTDRGPLEV